MVVKIKDKNLYYVGGVVRDEILCAKSFDTDFCYEGNALEFAKNYEVIRENPDFGTVKILYEGEEIDIASTRTETYPKAGHLPVVKDIGCSLKEDLQRRDFTINAMAKNTVTGEIVDFFDGYEDIKKGLLRVLHQNSFVDDPSRIIRALKFSVRFGFKLDDKTLKLQNEYLNNINYDMSYHRIKKELKETFNLNKQEALINFVDQNIYKLLGKNQLIPNIKCNIQLLLNKYSVDHVWLVYLGLFDLSAIELDGEEKTILKTFEKIRNKVAYSDIEIYRLFKGCPVEAILLYAISVNKDIAIKYLDEISKVQIEITGKDLLKIGISQGKIYKEILDYATESKILRPNLTKEELIDLIRKKYL